jgi:succinate dehydrogenase/fumarate reductase flavoprotein subunit
MSKAGAVITTDVDVLVIGGGFAGTWAALRAAERADRVALVDKGYVSRTGASTVSGGVTTAPMPDDDLEEWVKELAVLGGYEADQEWTRVLINDQMDRIRELDNWDVGIVKNDAGQIKRIKSRGMVAVRALQFSPRHAMEALRRAAIAAGTKIVDKVEITELLTSDGNYPTSGRVIGAIGFSPLDGTLHVFRAKSVILATGPLSMKGFHPIDNNTGDGFAMGYRVGGRYINMEFAAGGTFTFVWRGYHMGNFNIAVGHGAKLINAAGERFMERYDPVRFERSELNRVVAAFLKELIDGRGPVALDLRGVDDSYWTALDRARGGRPTILQSDYIPDPASHPVIIEPGWSFWNGGRGGLVNDLECRTNLPGLFAVGGVACNAGVGRHGSAGTPTAHCMVSGARAGIAAAGDAPDLDLPEIPDGLIERLREQIFSPLSRPVRLSADQLHGRLNDIMGSPLELMVQNAERIENCRARTAQLRADLTELGAADLHELVKFHEAKNLADSFELMYACMADRTESRESFYREDYPYTDDREWLSWHMATGTPDGIVFEKVPIPFDRYRYKPAELTVKMSPIGAIMRGEYDPAAYEDIYEPRP